MAYLDKVSLGGTLYDVTDTKGRAMIAPKEETSTASAAHATGTYFTFNDLLYRATADIAVGGTITPNTNCVAVTVGAETSELKSAINDISYIEVTSSNRFGNVLDKTGYYINAATGEDVANANFKCSSKFYPIGEYTVSINKILLWLVTSEIATSLSVVCYDSELSFLETVSVANMSSRGATVNINTRFFRVSAAIAYTGQFYVGTTAPSDPVDYTYTTRSMIRGDALPNDLQEISTDYENGLRLSQNNYSDEDKAKVDAIDESSEVFTSVVKSYFVGAGFTYSTPVAAWNQWISDGKPKAVFYISKGTYNVMSDPANASYTPFMFEDADVQIIGEDVNNTIIKSTTGKYIHSPIFIRSGNVTVKNITFIANHEDSPNFDYSQATTGLTGNAAYAMHIDGGSVGGSVIVENCRAWSWQSCGLGLGTIKDSSITIINCDVRSFTDAEASYADARVALSRGALVYHTYGADDTGEEVFSLINTFVYSKNGTRAMLITKNTGNAPKDIICKCNLIQGDAIASINDFVVGLNLLTLSEDSYGNNVNAMNYS